jgi:hypothetical protein
MAIAAKMAQNASLKTKFKIISSYHRLSKTTALINKFHREEVRFTLIMCENNFIHHKKWNVTIFVSHQTEKTFFFEYLFQIA